MGDKEIDSGEDNGESKMLMRHDSHDDMAATKEQSHSTIQRNMYKHICKITL